jgi:acyl-CoA thioester hydrolase
MISVETKFKVEFYDCDPMGVVYHGNYPRFLETARRLLMEKIGYSYIDMMDSNWYFPVTNLKIKYMRFLMFDDIVRIQSTLIEWKNCIKIKYDIYNDRTGEHTTKAESAQMAVNWTTKESSFVCPEEFITRVQVLLAKEGDK